MTIYVDDIRYYDSSVFKYPGHWCHMMTDGNIEELHSFAMKLGLKREYFQNHPTHPHYDLSISRRNKAIKLLPDHQEEFIKKAS